MAFSTYDIGDAVRFIATIRDENGTLSDPATLTWRIKEPDGTVTIYTFGEDDELEQDSTGVYAVEWTMRLAGVHHRRFLSTVPNQMEQTEFRVRKDLTA